MKHAAETVVKTILMAGGEGSRLRPLTIGRPKPMVPIVNKSVMAHMLDLLKSHSMTEVIATLRYMGNAIQDFFEDGRALGMEISYSIEESPLGTAGSVKHAAHLLTDTFLVVSGDALTDFDLEAIVTAHRESGAMATMALTHVPDPLEYGVIITDEQGQIVQFLEKPGWSEVLSDTVNTGIYVLEPEVLALIPDNEQFDFSQQLFPLMLEMKLPIFGYIAEGYWCDIGNIEEYRRANADLLNGKVNLPTPIGEHLGGGIWVGQDVEIAPDAQLFGPIYLGDEVKLKSDVIVHGPTVIRDYNIIDNYSRIERTIIWRNGYVGEGCELRGAVISRQCSIKSQVLLFEGGSGGRQLCLRRRGHAACRCQDLAAQRGGGWLHHQRQHYLGQPRAAGALQSVRCLGDCQCRSDARICGQTGCIARRDARQRQLCGHQPRCTPWIAYVEACHDQRAAGDGDQRFGHRPSCRPRCAPLCAQPPPCVCWHPRPYQPF